MMPYSQSQYLDDLLSASVGSRLQHGSISVAGWTGVGRYIAEADLKRTASIHEAQLRPLKRFTDHKTRRPLALQLDRSFSEMKSSTPKQTRILTPRQMSTRKESVQLGQFLSPERRGRKVSFRSPSAPRGEYALKSVASFRSPSAPRVPNALTKSIGFPEADKHSRTSGIEVPLGVFPQAHQGTSSDADKWENELHAQDAPQRSSFHDVVLWLEPMTRRQRPSQFYVAMQWIGNKTLAFILWTFHVLYSMARVWYRPIFKHTGLFCRLLYNVAKRVHTAAKHLWTTRNAARDEVA
jgi:hypothetical protein